MVLKLTVLASPGNSGEMYIWESRPRSTKTETLGGGVQQSIF